MSQLSAMATARTLPTPPFSDGVPRANPRADRYGGLFNTPIGKEMQNNADEGSYFITTSPTPGTGIAQTTSIAAYGATTPVILISNKDTAGGKRINLDYIRMILTSQVPTSATSWQSAIVLDNVNRYTSGGSVLTPSCSNIDLQTASIAQVIAGAIVSPVAGPGARIVGRHVARSVILVLNDEIVYSFGPSDAPGAQTLGGAVALRNVIPCGPVSIGPGETFLLYQWGPSNGAAPAFEIEIGHTER